ncbi:7TM-DISM domain-containing protein [Turneriella parva]|uniref:Transcriptional regulator, AraC family n=1 Tax=Turneriella parva (strain ATCC BAA-1111 / DSM 21527 / NCTC 11395 / H) TaxID=869212 RepID=I4B540_TURPD|nr:7TM-DISM domain-containing protein [Turneriella parva]AFM12397.1 transcriptional regulator, AraC family [Turneriella parva DSM 21527]
MRQTLFTCIVSLIISAAPLWPGQIAGEINITADVEFIEDMPPQLAFEQVEAQKSLPWQRVGKNATHFGFSRSAYWFRIDLKKFASFAAQKKIYAVFAWKALDSIEVFYRDAAGNTQKQIAGDGYPKSTWSLPETHFPAVQIQPDQVSGRLLFIRLQSTSIKNFPILLKTEGAYLHDLKRELTIIVIYSTITLILIAFAFFLYAISRDMNFLLYTGYLVSIALAFDTTFGNAFDLLWPNSTWWQNRAGFTLVGAQIIFSTLFVSRLLDFRKFLPRADFVCNALAIFCAISLPVSLLDLPVVWFSTLYSLIYLVSIPAFFGIGIYLLPKSGLHVRLFIIGWAILFFFGVFHILYLRSVLEYSGWIVYAAVLIFPVDILFFFMAAWEKQRLADRERLRLLDEKMQALIARMPGESKAKYRKSSLTDVDVQSTLARLKILMDEEKIYLIEDLRLPDLAKTLGLNRTQLSELLNSHFQKNFANFINEYRVGEAQRLLVENPHENVLDIAFATGFGSKAAFSTEFKRVTGVTAKEYREKNLQKAANFAQNRS